ncbi:collagen alpha-2(I) chain-like, partial [Homarus americanus]|uniref:collagen alpha-2(I) chain-like n=1 Tax=Homarus americanus TaxID=6706 RepID=UPI001C4867A0
MMMGDVVASPNALNNRKTTARRDHTGLMLLGNHPRATGNLLGVAGATWDPPRGSRGPRDPPRGSQERGSYPDKVVAPGTLQVRRAGALREPPRCGRKHPRSGWGPWDPPRGSRGPRDPSQRQLVTWFSPRDHTGLTLLGNHPRATGNLLGVAGATWDRPRGSRGPRDPPRGSQERGSYPDKVVPLGPSRDHTGQALSGNLQGAAGNILGVAGATWDSPRGSRGPRDPSQRQLVNCFSPRDHTGQALSGNLQGAAGNILGVAGALGTHPGAVEAPGTHPEAARNVDPIQIRWWPLGPSRCVGDPSKGGWDSLDPPMDGGPPPPIIIAWIAGAPGTLIGAAGPLQPSDKRRLAGALREPPRCGRKHPRSGWGPWDPPRGSRGPRDPSQRQLVTWFSPRAGALREPPRCGREHPSSGWGHWDPPRGSRGPMDPSQRQLVTWFSP